MDAVAIDAAVAVASPDAGTVAVVPPRVLPPPEHVTITGDCSTTTKTPTVVKRISGMTIPAARVVDFSCDSLSFADPREEYRAQKQPTGVVIANTGDELGKITGCAPPDNVDFSKERLVLYQYVIASSSDRRFSTAIDDGHKIHLVFDDTHTCQGTRTFQVWTTNIVALPKGKKAADAIVCDVPDPSPCRRP